MDGYSGAATEAPIPLLIAPAKGLGIVLLVNARAALSTQLATRLKPHDLWMDLWLGLLNKERATLGLTTSRASPLL